MRSNCIARLQIPIYYASITIYSLPITIAAFHIDTVLEARTQSCSSAHSRQPEEGHQGIDADHNQRMPYRRDRRVELGRKMVRDDEPSQQNLGEVRKLRSV